MIFRVLKIGLVDFWRNRWLSLAATVVMSITVLMVALFVLLNFSVNKTAEILHDKIDVSVFFKDAATDTQIAELQNLLKSRPDVKEVTYISKDEALTRFREQSKYRAKLLELLDQGYGKNLPRSISVKANDPTRLSDIASFIKQPPYDTVIDTISYQENKSVIDKLISSIQFVKNTTLILSLLFIGIAVLVVYNTINLTIFMRKEEIEIMQLVGATDWYIKFPFILEGVLYGILATIITTAILITSAKAIAPTITGYIGSAGFDFELFFFSKLLFIVIAELAVGVVIGGMCSYVAMRKRLR